LQAQYDPKYIQEEELMKVSEIMTHGVEGIQAADNVVHAAVRMRDFNVGAIPVFEGNKVSSMLTDRDIAIKVIASSLNPSHTSVGEVMTKGVVSCLEDTELSEAAKIMENYKVRRLLVKNTKDDITGILSLGDLSHHAAKELCAEVLSVVSEHPQKHH
jgi:CBS domain-containing protein